jgi:CheY-like chemotaxis protein
MLIVDDHADAAQMLAAILEMDGHTAAVVCDGRQALQTAAAFRPEVAFIDIDMPGMNGYETAQAMRKLAGLEQMALVALTGWDDMKSRIRAREAGFDHHLSKPTALATIRKVVSRIADSLAGT